MLWPELGFATSSLGCPARSCARDRSNPLPKGYWLACGAHRRVLVFLSHQPSRAETGPWAAREPLSASDPSRIPTRLFFEAPSKLLGSSDPTFSRDRPSGFCCRAAGGAGPAGSTRLHEVARKQSARQLRLESGSANCARLVRNQWLRQPTASSISS